MSEGARVIVGVSGSLGNLSALHYAMREARRRDAVLVPVAAWMPVGGEPAYRTHPCPPLMAAWEREARKRIDDAFERAFGGYPLDVEVEPTLVRAEPGPALTRAADRPGDLLVVGSGSHGRLARALGRSVSRYCLAHAVCTVVAVPPSELLKTLRHSITNADLKALAAA